MIEKCVEQTKQKNVGVFLKESTITSDEIKAFLLKHSGLKHWSVHTTKLNEKELADYAMDGCKDINAESVQRHMFKAELSNGKNCVVVALVFPKMAELEFYADDLIYRMIGMVKKEELEATIKKQFLV